ncbi:MAG: DUF6063 family protein, partial [Lachnospiraceae bacterium]|nr:DUF6063 family protein [Lachnospiraceae bacterium]
VYDTVHKFMDGFDMTIIDEYCDSIFVSCSISNKAFGYSNEEMRRKLKIDNNMDLYVIYFLIYVLIVQFYMDSQTPTYKSYVTGNEIIYAMDEMVKSVIGDEVSIALEDVSNDNNGLKNIAIKWNNIPNYLNNAQEDSGKNRPGVTSKAGYVKKMLRLMKEESLFVEENDMYYPTDRFHALAQYYFQNKGSEIHAVLNSKKTTM